MKRSKFSLSHYKLLTCEMGELIPIALTEVLPGDTIQQATSCLIRVSPLLAPVMHPVRVRIHHWFVPHRLVWDEWEDFITGGGDGFNSSAFPTKTLDGNSTACQVGGLPDYLGVPALTAGQTLSVSALPFRGYSLIWNEFYRDQDLQAELGISKDSGVDNATSVLIRNVSWEKDYFTSARPWTQKGPEVTIPFGADAPVVPDGDGRPFFTVSGGPGDLTLAGTGSNNSVRWSESGTGATVPNADAVWADPKLKANLSSATAVNINELRRAFALQRYEEARARYGSRYTEYLRYLGVRSSDARLQRPEYLGGGKQTLQFSEVLKTGGQDDSADPYGNMYGHGIGALRSNRYRRFFEEHGYIFSFISVLPKTIYAQGLPRTWSRRYKEDFFQRELQHIGQQEVFNKEIYAAHSQPEGVFGYQDRYDEYRRSESTIAGDFRDTLDFWHYARIFGNAPTLNSDFVTAVPTKRPNAVQTGDGLWIMANHSIQARRLVSGSPASFIY